MIVFVVFLSLLAAACANDRNVVKTPVPPAPQRTN